VLRGWLAACVVISIGAIGPERFVDAYVQQGRFTQAHVLFDELQRALGSGAPAPATLTRARIRLLLAERDWADGRVVAERCRVDEPIVCTFAQGYAAARLAWPGAKPERIAEAVICARQLEQQLHDPVSVTELYRVLVRAAIASAQEEAPELELLTAHAVSLEQRLRDTGQIDIPLQPASEIAGDLWMQIYREDAARPAYHATLEAWPRRAGALLGLARASMRAGDEAAAREAYRALLEVWQAADRTRPELVEAQRALGTVGGKP
jgi:tetratricopeptide (TPR) repeat protein